MQFNSEDHPLHQRFHALEARALHFVQQRAAQVGRQCDSQLLGTLAILHNGGWAAREGVKLKQFETLSGSEWLAG